MNLFRSPIFVAMVIASCCYLSVVSSEENKHTVNNMIFSESEQNVQRAANPHPPPSTQNPDECCKEQDKYGCASYRGTISTSKFGLKCIPWADLPADHKWHPAKHPDSGLVSNYCRNPDSNYPNAWCIVAIVTNRDPYWGDCDVPICPGECCEDNCASYRGEQNTGVYGSKCLNWNELPADDPYHPDKHPNSGLVSNYCRNPSGWRNAWCYIRIQGSNFKPDWENCALPNCTVRDSETCCDGNCASYRGTLSTSKSGKSCIPWEDIPNISSNQWTPAKRPNSGLESNYCRSPDSSHPNAWCYLEINKITKKPTKYEDCDINRCLARDRGECCDGNCESYRGEQSHTYDGRKCLPWADLPWTHNWHPSKNPQSGLVSNYCRNPSGRRNAWCIVKIGGRNGWDETSTCALPSCTARASEKCCDGNCRSYRGKLSITIHGKRCLPWNNLRKDHKYHPNSRPDAGLSSNYCRNPSGHHDAWCYTEDSWEPCALPQCSTEEETGCKWYKFIGNFCGQYGSSHDEKVYYACLPGRGLSNGGCYVQSKPGGIYWFPAGHDGNQEACNMDVGKKESGKYCWEKDVQRLPGWARYDNA